MTKQFKSILVFLMLLSALIPSTSFADDYVVKEPPKSLDKLYPPISKEPKWVNQMHKVSGTLNGVLVNVKENDWENAEKSAGRFVEAYEETSKLVPEWKDYFDNEAVKKFAETVKTRNPGKIWKAMGGVGKTCGKCHEENYVAVWTKYSWPSAEKIKVSDPVSEKELGYGKYMWKLSGSFNQAMVNFKDGQYDRALTGAKDLKNRIQGFKSACSKCHIDDAVKTFFVGPNVMNALDSLQAELIKDKPNPGVFWKNVGIIGKQACKRCHLTHRSYAIIQEVWEEHEHDH